MKVDRLNDTLDSLICILVNKFNLDPSQKYWLTLETGAIIEDITDLDKEDIVIIEKYATAYRPFPMFKEKKKKALKSRFVDPAPAYQYQPSYDPAYSMYPMYENINYNPNIPLMNS